MRFLRFAGVPALRLGLFFFFLFPPGASESAAFADGTKLAVSGEYGNLLVNDGKAALFSRNSLSLTPSPRFFLDFEFSRYSSDFSFLNGSFHSLKNEFGLDLSTIGFTFSSGFWRHGPAKAITEDFRLINGGGEGAFYGFAPFLRFGPLTLTPFFSRGKGFWRDGDLYVSLGKPELPSLYVRGLSALFTTGSLEQELSFRRVTADADLMTNLREPLFDIVLDARLYSYRFSAENARNRFSGSLGWLYTRFSLEGALTAANQHLLYFPYRFYNVNGLFEAHAIFGSFGFSRRSGIFRGGFDIGAFHFLEGLVTLDTRYKFKNWPYGGKEGGERNFLNVTGLGAAYLTLDGAIHVPPSGSGGKRVSFGVKKTFFLPWGYDGIFSSGEDPDREKAAWFLSGGSSALIKTVLLSGLSFTFSIEL